MRKIHLNLEITEVFLNGSFVVARSITWEEAERAVKFLRQSGHSYEIGLRHTRLPQNASTEIVQIDLYDITGLSAIRLLRCFRKDLAEILLQGYKADFPEHEFHWVDSTRPKAVQNALFSMFPAKGASDSEDRLFQSLSARLENEFAQKTHKSRDEIMNSWFPYPGFPWMSFDSFEIIFRVAWQRVTDYLKWAPLAPSVVNDENESAVISDAIPRQNVGNKYYAVARGAMKGIFMDVAMYDKATRGFPNALARAFDSREAAEAWLRDPVNINIPNAASKKYYAVARGTITGIFTDVAMYNKATRGFPNAMARAFKNPDEAKAWLSSVRNEKAVQINTKKESREERWKRQNEALLAANRVEKEVSAKSSNAIAHTSDPNQLLAERLERFFGLPMETGTGVSAKFTDIPKYLKPETQGLLSFGQAKGYDYLRAGCSILTAREDYYRVESQKKITAEWMKEANIPSGYKILMNDFVGCCLRMACFVKNSDIPQNQENAAASSSTKLSRISSVPAPLMQKKFFAAILGKNPVVFSNADTYEKLSRQFPDAPMRAFDSRKEADAWLREIADNPSIWEKGNKTKYYAVARGKITGIFTDVEMYDKATRGVSDALARSFRDRNSAEAWLASISEKTVSQNSGMPKTPLTESPHIQSASKDNVKACGITINASAFFRKQNTEEKNVLPVQEMHISNTPVSPDVTEEPLDETSRSSAGSSPTIPPAPQRSLFHGIQFDKHIFRGMPAEAQQRFRKTFAQRLTKLGRIFHGGRDAGNDFKLVAPTGRRVFKRRIGKNRLSMIFKDGILTLLKFSTHDRQMADIRNIHGKTIGYVYYDTEEFLRQMDAWPEVKADEHLSFGDYMASPRHFVFDRDQEAIIESGEKSENLSVIGNAGAGKSVVGLKWLNDQLQKPNHDCLYLTMSENLVYTLDFEFKKGRLAEKEASRADIRTTFDFLRDRFKKRYPKIAEKNLLNAAQSFALFRRFWAEEVDWTQFWNYKDKNFALQSEESTLLAAWREIHGILKGAVPIGVDYGKLKKLPEVLPEAEYRERLRQEKKDSVRDVLWIDTLYSTYEKYQEYLRRRQLLDDNDVARMLLQTSPDKSKNYAAAFVDECQDLTQMELLAIFHLLGGVKVKRMSSDRCQMVQPTYFDEGWMRTTANEYDRHLGKAMEASEWKPRYLHYNYRSSKSIIEFQNYAVQYLRYSDILTLKQLETEEILVPPLTPPGVRPIWIVPGEENQRILIDELWKKLDASELQTIFAFPASFSKSDFPLTDADAVTDVVSCKGMEYPSVLLYNVLSETRFNPVMAWKYFYVGATRSNRCLLIYEKDAVPGTRVYDFLSDAAKAGLIDRCDHLLMQAKEGNLTWLGYIYQCVSENADENRLETAENALNFGQYELALNIFTQEGKDKNMIAYCRGKVLENRGDFHQAIESYASLDADWNDRGRTRENSVDSMMRHPDIDGVEFLGAYLLSQRGAEDLLPMAKAAWASKYGKDAGFYEAFFDALELYPFAAEPLHRWTEGMIANIEQGIEKIRQTAAGWEG